MLSVSLYSPPTNFVDCYWGRGEGLSQEATQVGLNRFRVTRQTDVILGLLISGFQNVVYRQLVASLDGEFPFARPPATFTEHIKKADILIQTYDSSGRLVEDSTLLTPRGTATSKRKEIVYYYPLTRRNEYFNVLKLR
jgi:hypothetical protein